MELIDKSALVAEIERRRKLVSDPILSDDDLMIGERNALFNLLSFINTLEVKEADLEKKLDANKVIEWLMRNVPRFFDTPCNPRRIVEQFKEDFGL